MNTTARRVTIAATLALVLAIPASTQAGDVTVIDGDTLDIGGTRIRLHGIDAPESGQTCADGPYRWSCGQHATQALSNLIANRGVVCRSKGRDSYGRTIGACRAGAIDINAWMVRQGLALAYERYSRDYVEQQRAARASGNGMWRGTFVEPWRWRRGERLKVKAPAQRQHSVQCNIKGNVSDSGELIYHEPSGQFYDVTRISAAKNERWFCSKTEAEAAGWRKSKR